MMFCNSDLAFQTSTAVCCQIFGYTTVVLVKDLVCEREREREQKSKRAKEQKTKEDCDESRIQGWGHTVDPRRAFTGKLDTQTERISGRRKRERKTKLSLKNQSQSLLAARANTQKIHIFVIT